MDILAIVRQILSIMDDNARGWFYNLGFLFCCIWYIDLVLSDWVDDTRHGFVCIERGLH